jgi:hypothetical protein
MKRRCTIFQALVGQVQFPDKRAGTCYTIVLFLHPMGSDCHVVHFGASEARNINVLVLMLRWDQCGFHKNMPPHVALNLCFASGGIYGSHRAFQCVRGTK